MLIRKSSSALDHLLQHVLSQFTVGFRNLMAPPLVVKGVELLALTAFFALIERRLDLVIRRDELQR